MAVINTEKIHQFKRDQVLSCIEIVKKHPAVTKMIIFGSAVTKDCTETSDVDICLDIQGSTRGREFYELARDMSWACDHHCDILTYGKLGNVFKQEIEKKGVVVYELS